MPLLPDADAEPLPSSYWVVAWAEIRTYVDPEQALSARKQFEHGATILEFEDIFGSTNWIPASRLAGIWDSSPDMRQKCSQHEAMLKAETGYGDA